MIKSPIQEVTNKLQYRAIGIVNGVYKPHDNNQINRGILIDKDEKELETVILGRALSLIKKHIKLEKNYFWIVYPRNKNKSCLHLQVAGIWDPYQLNKAVNKEAEKDPNQLLKQFKLSNNYFSIRGELIYVNSVKKEVVIKICSSQTSKKFKKSSFKIIIEGEIPLKYLNSFVSLNVIKDGNTLKMINFEIIEKNYPKTKSS